MDKRQALIFTAAKMIHEKGYHHVGIKGILDELSIPKGSFYHYFKSKEDLGLAIIDAYIEDTEENLLALSKDLQGLRDFFDIYFDRLKKMSFENGCPMGNLILELSDENEIFRNRMHLWYEKVYRWFASVLESNEITESEAKAKVLFAAFEGIMMVVKLDKQDEHFEYFHQYILNPMLKDTQ